MTYDKMYTVCTAVYIQVSIHITVYKLLYFKMKVKKLYMAVQWHNKCGPLKSSHCSMAMK